MALSLCAGTAAQLSMGSAPADLSEKSKGSPSKEKYLTSYIHKINLKTFTHNLFHISE